MSKNIDDIDLTVIAPISIYITYTFLQWSWICNNRPVPFASMWYNPPKKVNSNVDNSIVNGQ